MVMCKRPDGLRWAQMGNKLGIYCRVPEGSGLHKTARPPSHNETLSVYVYRLTNYQNKKAVPTLDLF